MATMDVFSEDDLAQPRKFPEPARAKLIRYFTISSADEAFARKFRGLDNVPGAAIQRARSRGWGTPGRRGRRGGAAIGEVGIPDELRGYGARKQTRTGHLREVAACLGWRQVDGPRWKDLEEFLFTRVMEHDSPKLPFRLACE
jgi:hypothetical protein